MVRDQGKLLEVGQCPAHFKVAGIKREILDDNAWLGRWWVTDNTHKPWPGISMFQARHMGSHMDKVKLDQMF